MLIHQLQTIVQLIEILIRKIEPELQNQFVTEDRITEAINEVVQEGIDRFLITHPLLADSVFNTFFTFVETHLKNNCIVLDLRK